MKSIGTAVLATAIALAAGSASAQQLRLMTGPQGGSWYPLGGAIQNIIEKSMPGTSVQVLPGADHTALAPCVHLEAEAGLEPDAMLRLATLGDCDAPTRLRLSKADAKSLTDLRTAAIEGAPAHEIGYRMGATQGLRAMILRAALMGVPMTDAAEVALGAAAKFPVKAADLMPRYAGAQLGLRLRQLEKRWIEGHFAPTRDDLLNSPD